MPWDNRPKLTVCGGYGRQGGMSTTRHRPMTLAQFLLWEEQREERWEFDGFEPVPMNGATIAHSLIQANLVAALHGRLRGGPCRVHGGGIKIEVAGRIRYPDAVIFCSPQQETATVAVEPIVVFEVVSPNSARTDRIAKVREYGETQSIRRYVILEQTSQAATVFSRTTDGWAGVVIEGDVDLALPELEISVPLRELYLEVGFPERDGA